MAVAYLDNEHLLRRLRGYVADHEFCGAFRDPDEPDTRAAFSCSLERHLAESGEDEPMEWQETPESLANMVRQFSGVEPA